jgi:hypothetical protein
VTAGKYVETILDHYMATPAGRQKVLASAVHPALNLASAMQSGLVPRDPDSVLRYEALLCAVPQAERSGAWEDLSDAVEFFLRPLL